MDKANELLTKLELAEQLLKDQQELLKFNKEHYIDYKFRCPDCGKELHWESDIDMYDYMEEEGIISFYHCCDCNLEIEVRRYDNPEECACEENYDEPF